MKGKPATDEEVRLIRACAEERERLIAERNRLDVEIKGLSNARLAEKFDIAVGTVCNIISGRTHAGAQDEK